jgi:predicted nucleotidyltransferase
MSMPADKLERYKRTAYGRWQAERRQQEARRALAWELARQAAALLKHDYGAERVVVFGSLTHPGRFTLQSDVDIAAWGLTSANWLQAGAAVRELSDEIDINLVDVGACSPELSSAIERDGIVP